MKNKTFLIIIFSSIILIILIIINNIIQPKKKNLPEISPNISPTLAISKTLSPTITLNPQELNIQLKKIKEEHVIISPTSLPIKDIFLTQLQDGIPSSWIPVSSPSSLFNKDGRKFSPHQYFYALLNSKQLQIFMAEGDKKVRSIKWEKETVEVNFVWLSDKFILIIEKNTSKNIDNLYLIDYDTGEKSFLFSSYPVPLRFDLSKNPQVYNNGKDIVLSDNEAGLWNLSLSLK